MDDLHYDAMQKKSIARGARARKCGSKSKRCSLPSDKLTDKQWKERCGRVMEFNLSKPMQWKELRSMPDDLQLEYLKKLSTKYAVSLSKLSDMLGVHPVTVRRYLQETGAYKYYDRGRGYKMPEGSVKAFEEFLRQDSPFDNGNGDLCIANTENKSDETQNHDNPHEFDVDRIILEKTLPDKDYEVMIRNSPKLSSFKFTMNGPADIMSVANSLRLFVKDGENVEITVEGLFI